MDSWYLGFSSLFWVDPVFLGVFLTCFVVFGVFSWVQVVIVTGKQIGRAHV